MKKHTKQKLSLPDLSVDSTFDHLRAKMNILIGPTICCMFVGRSVAVSWLIDDENG